MAPSLSARFHALFSGLDRAHGTTKPGSLKLNKAKGKMDGRSFIEKKPLTEQLWEQHLAGKYGLGVFPLKDNGTCRWGAIDIDVYDLDHTALEQHIQQLKLPLIMARTKSGGAHLFLFLTHDGPAALVRSKLAEWAVALGHSGVEVFPKQDHLDKEDDFGNWLNMPYQGGARTTRYAFRDGKGISDPAEFMDYAEVMRVAAEDVERFELELLTQEEDPDDVFKDGPPCLQTLAAQGFPEGSRNDGLYNCAIYSRKRFPAKWREHVALINDRFMKPPLSEREVSKLEGSVGKKETYFYKCRLEPIVSVCNRPLCLTRRYGIGGAGINDAVKAMVIIKLETQPVTWIADINNVRIEIDTATLVNQRVFRLHLAEVLNVLIPLVKQPIWDKMVDEKIRNAEILSAPLDASPEGQLLTHLEDFCTDSQAMDKEELLGGLPYTEEGRTFFRSSDFKLYLETKRVRGWTDRGIWAALRRLGAANRQFQIKGKFVETWSVPAFAQQDAEFSVPPTVEKEEF